MNMNKAKIGFLLKKTASAVLTFFCFLQVFAKSSKSVTLDPNAAVKSLAGIERKAQKPTEGVYYSLFVRSFADSNKDGIGDLKGIIQKLDYLNDGKDETTSDLGITGIWLLPIFPSSSYHGYNVDDYYDVNPDYGTLADFELLAKECKKRGIALIIDMTCNHASSSNQWFIQSKNPDSPYREWFRWVSDEDAAKGLVNLKQKVFGHNVWNVDLENPGKSSDGKDNYYYYAGVFDSSMPDFNLDCQAVRDEFKKIFKFWMDKGATGFRFDAASHTYNTAELKIGEKGLEKAVSFWKEMTDYIKSVNPDSYCVSEVWENAATRARYLAGMQSNFQFDLGGQIAGMINNQETNEKQNSTDDTDVSTYNGYARSLESLYELYSQFNKDYINAPFLSNHDQARSAALFRNKTDKMKLAADLYILTEGIPFIYYGEEIAMKSGADDPSKRTPMLWKPNAKDKNQTKWTDHPLYSSANRYNTRTETVAEQQKDSDSLLNHYKRVIRIKTAHPALFRGRLKARSLGSSVIESYVMECDTEKAFVIHNVSSMNTVDVKLPDDLNMPMVYAANPSAKIENGTLSIPPLSSVVLASGK